MTGQFVTRFAPSPTGYLHLGHAFSAFTAAGAASDAGGRFLLRIEDIDTQRCRPKFEMAIFEDLAWLGLQWETPVRRQSEHMGLYQEALSRLIARNLVRPCARTRREFLEGITRAPQAGDPADERTNTNGDDIAWRLSCSSALDCLDGDPLTFLEEGAAPDGQSGAVSVDPEQIGDVVLGRKGLGVSYHLAAVVDDASQNVSHVIRGNDLFAASHVQRLLQALLGLPSPIYRHHRLILRPDGKRFAKRDTGETLRNLRSSGVSPAEVRSRLGFPLQDS